MCHNVMRFIILKNMSSTHELITHHLKKKIRIYNTSPAILLPKFGEHHNN